MSILKATYKLKGVVKFLRETSFINQNWRVIRYFTTSDTTQEYRGKVYDQIKSRGKKYGQKWPGFHDMTQRFVYGRIGRPLWQKRFRLLGRANYNWLMQFVTSRVNRSGTFGRVRFGRGKTSFSRRIEERAIWMEQGHKTVVTEAHRRLWGATREADKTPRGSQEPGVTFFPMTKDLKTITIKERPIMEPVYRSEAQQVPVWYQDFLQKTVDKYRRKA